MTDISTELFDSPTLAQEGEQVSEWPVRPFQLVSLLEMLKHNANLFYSTTHKLCQLQAQIAKAIEARDSDSIPTKNEADNTRRLIKRIEGEAERLKFFRVVDRLAHFNDDEALLQPLVGRPFTLSKLQFHLEELNNEIRRALGENMFMMIPANKAGYYDNPKLFDSDVAAKFPKANKEIQEAGNCYATGSNTACIFHLMRAAEHGLRELATKLNVSFPKNPQKEIELRMWSEVIKAVIDAINAKPNAKNQSEAEELECYNKAADQIQFFKDAWRDVIMHSREPRPYNEHDAMSAIVSVQTFMQLIASLP